MNNIQAEELLIGKNTIIEPTASIRGINGKAKKIAIGDNCYIGNDVQIICDNFKIGDYSKIHHHTNIHGYKPCEIGHNAWIGQYAIIDSIGGTTIGDNCCIGASSHLWSHIKFGDLLEGCQFLHDKPLNIGSDVWIAGHCSIAPVTIADKSMILANSMLTKDTKFNEVYAGSPAISISKKIGCQFKEVSLEEKLNKMKEHLNNWNKNNSSIKIISTEQESTEPEKYTYFNVANRKYNKRQTEEEISFIKFLLPEKAKFTPR